MTNYIDRRLDRLETEVRKTIGEPNCWQPGRDPVFKLIDDPRDPENPKRLEEARPDPAGTAAATAPGWGWVYTCWADSKPPAQAAEVSRVASEQSVIAIDKIASSERHNKSGIMSAPTPGRGVRGMGDTEIGAALSLGESGLDLITNKK